MNHKNIKSLLLLLILGLFLVACGGGDTPAEPAEEVVAEEPAAEPTEAPAAADPEPEPEPTEAPEPVEELSCSDAIGCVEIAAGDPIRLASALVVTGPNESLGLDSQYGVEIAIKDRGELFGHAIELQPEDDGCSAEGGQTAGQKIVSDPSIAGVIGTSCSGAGVPMSQIVCEEGIVMVSPSNTAPVLTDEGSRQSCYFRTAHNDKIQGKAMADFVFNELGITKAAAIHDGDPYTEGLATVFRDSFIENGGEIVAFEAEAADATNVEPLLTSVAAAGPELIYYPVFIPLGSLLTKTAQEIDGLEGVVLAAADGVQSPDFIEASGDAAEGMYLSGPNLAFGNSIYDNFLATYQADYGTEPTAPFHAHAYDATNMILDGIAAVAEVDGEGNMLIGRQALIDAVGATSGMAGITGTISCDANGDCADANIAISQITGGEFMPIGAAMDDSGDDMMAMEPASIRFAYYGDGAEPEVMQSLIDQFTEMHPEIEVMLDIVPYATIDQQLPVQVETGEGPDMARITNFGVFNGHLLDMTSMMSDPSYVRANFPAPVLDAMGDAGGVYGFPDGFTVTGPYVNVTLFEQAGVDLPGEGASWADWTAATTEVAEATGVQYAISIDRTGHRFAGPAMSSGATLIDSSGNFTVDTPGFRSFAEQLKGWHDDDITPSEVWLVGDSVNSCIDAFKSGELVMCMSGSWQVNGIAADVGDAFDWAVVPNPTGDGGSTGVAGGSAVVAFADTEYPAQVAALMEWLASAEAYSQFSAGTLILPAQTEVASNGVDYATDNPAVLAALEAYTAEIPKLQDQAVQLNVHPFAFAYYRNSANRVGQYLAGELDLDQALSGLQQDIDDAIAEAMASMPAEEEEMMELEAAELRFAYYGDGAEPEIMQSLIDQFSEVYPQVEIVLDVVPYATIDQQLPVQVETGEGPDMARITNFGVFNGQLLDMSSMMGDADYVRNNFPVPVLDAMGDAGGVYGFPDGFTVTGPYVNTTLFEQAGVDLPGAGASWADWTAATTEVAEVTGVKYAISIDRTGHRFAGPAMSSGATLIDANGNFTVDTDGFRSFAEQLNSWHTEDVTPSEVWLVGDSVNSCIDAFKSGELVMCMSGSWQINGIAADVGDAFDWAVVPNPTGDGGSTGVAGGSAVVAFADTEYPQQVAVFMEWLASAEAYSQFSAGTLILPAQTEVAATGVDYATDDAAVLAALSAFTAEIPNLQDQAVQLNVHPYAFAYYRNSANRIGQYLAGELDLTQAVEGLQQDIDDAIAEAGG